LPYLRAFPSRRSSDLPPAFLRVGVLTFIGARSLVFEPDILPAPLFAVPFSDHKITVGGSIALFIAHCLGRFPLRLACFILRQDEDRKSTRLNSSHVKI